MILTLTTNSALDRLLFVEEFVAGATMRPHKMRDCVGGKGFDTSVVLRCLGVETFAVGFVAGDHGRRLVQLLDGYGIPHDLVWLEGDTRIAHVVIETKLHRHSHLIAGQLTVHPPNVEQLLQRCQAHLAKANWLVVAGSIPPNTPPDLYHTVTTLAQAANVPILIDSTGAPILHALAARPTVVKMNWSEFNQTFQTQTSTLADLAAQAKTVFTQRQLSALVITCAEQGILAFTPEGDYLAAAPVQQAINAAGAGDASSAALVWRLAQGESWHTALQWVAAVSAAAVLTEATAEVEIADVARIWSEVQVEAL